MRTISMTAAALALLSTTAMAQTMTPRDSATASRPATTGTHTGTTTANPAATSAPVRVASNPLMQEDISAIEGASVYDGDNSKIGSVANVLMNPQTKTIDRLVVSAGGVLGVGSHRVALPLDQFTWDSEHGGFKVSTNLASLKAMPEWVEGNTATGSSEPSASRPMPPTNAGDNSNTAH
ncbi:MAG TPA: PRC-barrel domain-containing protein [Stellaceae bacterium]|nr:PRC-barrel domain-containing protein [Stellaceae bacterium]